MKTRHALLSFGTLTFSPLALGTLALAAAGLLLFPANARAQERLHSALDLPPGQMVIQISTSDRVEVDQDLLIAHLRYEAENADSRTLQNEINTLMKKAVDAAKATPDVKVQTQQYYVYAHDPNDHAPRAATDKPAPRVWRGSQGLEVKSLKADTLLELVAKLQDMGLTVGNLSYTLSPEVAETTRDGLMEGALKKLQAKADRAAKALGKGNARLIDVIIDSDHNYPQPMMMRAASGMASDAMNMPVATPGQTEISMTVSARALLQ